MIIMSALRRLKRPRPYVLHYTSDDGTPEGRWSVYREQYRTFEDEEPIDGTQEWVSSWPTEDAADAEANRLQREQR
jgi:hypothetical protein